MINRTNPDMTESCWLCLASVPPYYKEIAVSGTFITTSSHEACVWGTSQRLTLPEVTGTWLGNPLAAYRHLCNTTLESPSTSDIEYLFPGLDKWWACSTGLTPCVSTLVFDNTKDYCVLIQLVPRVFYHPTNSFVDEFVGRLTRYWKEPVTLTLAVILGIGVTAGVGTGTTALIGQLHYFQELRSTMSEYLRALGQSITKLKESLTSLSELVLQNRRGLDLLFLKEGGLCVALKKECCFYKDHSGVIEDSMKKLRERLDKRQRERDASQGWFKGWFNKTPWLTTLISTIMGPLFILLLLLIMGPCILNQLVAFIRESWCSTAFSLETTISYLKKQGASRRR